MDRSPEETCFVVVVVFVVADWIFLLSKTGLDILYLKWNRVINDSLMRGGGKRYEKPPGIESISTSIFRVAYKFPKRKMNTDVGKFVEAEVLMAVAAEILNWSMLIGLE